MTDLERVRNLARLVATRYSLTVPVDLTSIIHDVCTIETDTALKIDGYTILDCRPPKIVLRSDVHIKRKRFTIAHELGHILIPWHNGKNTYANHRNSSSFLDKNEAEADAFAAELLLPQHWMEQYLQKASEKPLQQQINEITGQANVSVLACIRSLQQYWHGTQMLFYTLPDWEYYQVSTSKEFHFARYMPSENRTLEFYKNCAAIQEHFRYGSYEMFYFRFWQLPQPRELVQRYYAVECNVGEWIVQITGGYPARAVPFLDILISLLPDRVMSLVFLNGHEPAAFYSPRLNSYYYPELSNYEKEKAIVVQQYPAYEVVEMELGGFGKLLCLKAPYNTAPKEYSDNPNLLLHRLLGEVYLDREERILAGQKVNGFLGGNNNRKDKGTVHEFYDELFDRMRTEPLLAPLIQHREFPRFLLGKIHQMLSK